MSKSCCVKNITNEPCEGESSIDPSVADGTYLVANITIADQKITAISGDYNSTSGTLNIGGNAPTFDDNQIIIGKNASCSGAKNGIAIGLNTTAGHQAIAIGASNLTGFETQATTSGCLALGADAKATQIYAASIGENTDSSARYGLAFMRGAQNTANQASLCMGCYANMSGDNSILIAPAEGSAATPSASSSSCSGNRNVGIGYNLSLAADDTVAIGNNARVGDDGAIAIGLNSNAPAADGVAIGNAAVASTNGVAIGKAAECDGDDNIVIGRAANIASQTPKADNIAIGRQALIGNASATPNEGNVVIGPNAQSQTGGIGGASEPNTILGKDCQAQVGSANTLLGISNSTVSTNDYCVMVGYNNKNGTGALDDYDNCILIGKDCVAGGDGDIWLNNGLSSGGRVFLRRPAAGTKSDALYYDSTTHEVVYGAAGGGGGGANYAMGTITIPNGTGGSGSVSGLSFEPTMVKVWLKTPTSSNAVFYQAWCTCYNNSGSGSGIAVSIASNPFGNQSRTTSQTASVLFYLMNVSASLLVDSGPITFASDGFSWFVDNYSGTSYTWVYEAYG